MHRRSRWESKHLRRFHVTIIFDRTTALLSSPVSAHPHLSLSHYNTPDAREISSEQIRLSPSALCCALPSALDPTVDSVAFGTETKIFTRACGVLSGWVPAKFFHHILLHSIISSASSSISGFLCFLPDSEPLKCCTFFLECHGCFSLSLRLMLLNPSDLSQIVTSS